MKKKEFDKLFEETNKKISQLQKELWNRNYFTRYNKLIQMIVNCKRGHSCYCDKETKKLCKKVKKERGYTFDEIQTLLWHIECSLER